MRLILTRSVVAELHEWQQQPSDTEAGGILVGRFTSERAIVQHVSTPGPEDVRLPHSFTRAVRHHNEFLSQRWVESNGTSHYMGEWHTHNEVDLRPSELDSVSLKALFDNTAVGYRKPCLFCVIVGRFPFPTGIVMPTGLSFPLWVGIMYPGMSTLQDCPFTVEGND